MQKFAARRRFIAGVVCPRCRAMDTMVVDLDTDQRECVACDFSEERPQAAEPGTLEPRTRVNRPARQVETPAEAVRLVDPDPEPQSR